MLDSAIDPARIEVWAAMAGHFLDTETRQEIPLTAACCLDAGLSVAQAREVWCYEVSPAVGFNAWSVAGEWEGWDREWLIAEIARTRQTWYNRAGAAGWLRYHATVHVLHGVWSAIARCMEVLLRFPEADRRRVSLELATLARHYFDVSPDDLRTLGKESLQRIESLYAEPFTRALKPVVGLEGAVADCRVRVAMRAGLHGSAPGIDRFGHFSDALARVGATCSGDAVFAELIARYSNAPRCYHTLDHVEACLVWLDRYASLAERPAEIALGLWFHDAVYNPRASDNEQRSAALAREHLSLLDVAPESIARIEAHILATREHTALCRDSQLMVDLDLSILGSSPEQFDDFERRIRCEYAHVGPIAYRFGRRRVLRRLLDRPRIYRVQALHDQFEVLARANLRRGLSALRWI